MSDLITNGILPVIRIINTILIVCVTAVWTCTYFKYKQAGMLAPIFWLIDVLGFYIFRFYALEFPTQTNIDLINLWSSIIIFHGIILLLLTDWVIELRLFKFKMWRRNEKI